MGMFNNYKIYGLLVILLTGLFSFIYIQDGQFKEQSDIEITNLYDELYVEDRLEFPDEQVLEEVEFIKVEEVEGGQLIVDEMFLGMTFKEVASNMTTVAVNNSEVRKYRAKRYEEEWDNHRKEFLIGSITVTAIPFILMIWDYHGSSKFDRKDEVIYK